MTKEGLRGIGKEFKGVLKKMGGVLTGNENRKLEGESEIVEGDNLKDYADQRENIEKGKDKPGNPSNM
ncbi:CsbD family protein [Paraburkholderia lycopersici]|uniref:CsbD-like n=1 Tax=Paraburkholderia lycopersici TaxID=416944 RepID=A0A1G6YIS1_9BURK|nr:CsbD family protein [Paraburkholderia lycopersici]SDD90404.1 hypothetical protein SAMN05421548_1283 [Paraburkholderia lycopersici]